MAFFSLCVRFQIWQNGIPVHRYLRLVSGFNGQQKRYVFTLEFCLQRFVVLLSAEIFSILLSEDITIWFKERSIWWVAINTWWTLLGQRGADIVPRYLCAQYMTSHILCERSVLRLIATPSPIRQNTYAFLRAQSLNSHSHYFATNSRYSSACVNNPMYQTGLTQFQFFFSPYSLEMFDRDVRTNEE